MSSIYFYVDALTEFLPICELNDTPYSGTAVDNKSRLFSNFKPSLLLRYM